MSRNANAAVFLDRDGTIIEDRGHLRDPSEVVFFPDTFDALRRLREHFLLFIVTNQVGVAEGIITLGDVERINRSIVAALDDGGIAITDVYVCPHKRADKCPCMKPQPYFLRKAAERYDVDLRASFTVGDHPHDVQLAENAGARGIYVLTGHGRKHVDDLPHPAPVASGIAEAAEMILAGRTAAQRRGRKAAPKSCLPCSMLARQEKRVDAGEVVQVQFPGLFGHS
jgi:histidinol-phosphate phosphatase family protein